MRRPGPENASPVLRAAHHVLPPAAGLAARAVRPLHPLIRGVLATRERVEGRDRPAASRAARWTFGAVSGVTASAGAVGRGRWRVRRLVLRRQAAGRSYRPEPARGGLERVGRLASDFAAADLVDAAVAESIGDGLESALTARSRLEPHGLDWATRRRLRQQRPLPAGPIRAYPVGRPVVARSEYGQVPITLLAVVLAPDRADVTLTGRLPAVPDGGDQNPHRNWYGQLRSATATDDRGGTYEAGFTGGWGESRIDGALSFHPRPPAGTRWLDVRVGESDPVRIEVPARQPVTAARVDEDAAPLERFIDSVAERFLSHSRLHDAGDVAEAPEVIAALREIGAVSADSPALRRLAALLRRLGPGSPAIHDVRQEDLPAPWASVLDGQDATDGPVGVSPLAVVFPEIDGIRCVLTGLRSDPDSAWLQLTGWDWPEPVSSRGELTEPLSVWARDDTGRWHLGTGDGAGFGGGHGRVTVRLTPPIHPMATSLEITLTGKSARAVATVPLAWQDQP